jgi:hypothetical protein
MLFVTLVFIDRLLSPIDKIKDAFARSSGRVVTKKAPHSLELTGLCSRSTEWFPRWPCNPPHARLDLGALATPSDSEPGHALNILAFDDLSRSADGARASARHHDHRAA